MTRDAATLADQLGVRIFTADIIYHLFDQFTAYLKLVGAGPALPLWPTALLRRLAAARCASLKRSLLGGCCMAAPFLGL